MPRARWEEELSFEAHKNHVTCVAVFPSGDKVITGSDDRSAIIWDAITGQVLHELDGGHEKEVTSVAVFLSEDRVLTGSRDKKAIVWDSVTERMNVVLEGHMSEIWSVDVFPTEESVITASIDRRIIIWNANNGRALKEIEMHDNWITTVAVFPSGNRILTGSADNKAVVWDMRHWDQLNVLHHEAQVYAAAVFPSEQRVITGGLDKKAVIWRLSADQEQHVIQKPDEPSRMIAERVLIGHAGPIYSVAVFPDEQWVLTGSFDRKAIIWDVNVGTKIFVLGHRKLVLYVAVFPGAEDKVITTGGDQRAIIWRATDTPKRGSIDSEDTTTIISPMAAVQSEEFAPVLSEDVTDRPTDREWGKRLGSSMAYPSSLPV